MPTWMGAGVESEGDEVEEDEEDEATAGEDGTGIDGVESLLDNVPENRHGS